MAEATTSSPDSPTTPPGGHSRLKVAGLVLLGVLALVALVVFYRVRQTSDRLRLALEDMDRKDPGWRLEDIEAARAVVPDGQNSGLIVMEVSRQLPKNWPL